MYHRPVRRALDTAAIWLTIVTASTSACATYHPRAGRFISRDAGGTYHRDGQDFNVSTFGDSAESLVSGDPRALEYVRRYKHSTTSGCRSISSGSRRCSPRPSRWRRPCRSGRKRQPFGALRVGPRDLDFGLAFTFKGDAALIDAVNVYNDERRRSGARGAAVTRAARAVTAALLVAQLACAGASSYEPRRSPRIAAVHINGRVYVRDGQRYEISLLGGGGEELVASNEAATALMRKHRRKQIWAWSLLGLGLGTVIAGNAMLCDVRRPPRPVSP